MGVPDDSIRDTPHQGPPHSAESSTSHNYQASLKLVGKIDDLVGAASSHPDVGLLHCSSKFPDAPDLLVKHLLSFLSKLLGHFFDADIIGRFPTRSGDDMQLGVGGVCYVDGGL